MKGGLAKEGKKCVFKPTGTILAILVKGHKKNISVKLF